MIGSRTRTINKRFDPLVVALLLGWMVCGGAGAAEIRWAEVEQEGLSLLSRYIQVDTTNPPGNEIRAADFFKRVFEREGIAADIIESAPGRGNIVARLPGSGRKKALVLMNHMDVVPADARFWKEAPFGGVMKDGYVWGRGALDMKGPAILELMTVLLLKRSNTIPAGDLIFLGTADEEAGGALGAGYLLEREPRLFKDTGLVLNEGGGIRLGSDNRARYYSVGVAEKTPLWLRVTASGRAGHGATPGDRLAVHRLIRALDRLVRYQFPINLLPEVAKFYADTAGTEHPAQRAQYADLRAALADPSFAAEFMKDPRNSASVRNTLSITGLKGSGKVNVIPAEATAEIDMRLLPGENPERVIAELRRVMADEGIKIEVLLSFPPAVSPPQPEAMRAIRELAQTHDGGVPVVSPLGRGFTDCHFFREKALPCYGFIPLRRGSESEGLEHGIDERISTENFKLGLHAMVELVRKLIMN